MSCVTKDKCDILDKSQGSVMRDVRIEWNGTVSHKSFPACWRMPQLSMHQDLLNQYILSMLMCHIFTPADQQIIEHRQKENDLDISTLLSILLTCYPNGQPAVPKLGNMGLAWGYAENPANHHHFVNMLHVTPLVFQTILTLIEDHPAFMNGSNNAQAPVEQQLATTLFWMKRYGNDDMEGRYTVHS